MWHHKLYKFFLKIASIKFIGYPFKSNLYHWLSTDYNLLTTLLCILKEISHTLKNDKRQKEELNEINAMVKMEISHNLVSIDNHIKVMEDNFKVLIEVP